MLWWVLLLSSSVLLANQVESTDLDQYSICCHHCRADQDLWVTFQPSWNVTVADKHLLDFLHRPSVLTEDHIIQRTQLYERDYYIRYGGAAIHLTYTEAADSAAILDDQFLQVNLETESDVAGVKMQAGFYEDAGGVLFFRRSSWVTHFLVSSTRNELPEGFSYITDTGGNPQVFKGTSDAISSVLVSFDQTVRARYVRLHPLKAYDDDGQTSSSMFRASIVTCMTDGVCYTPRVNCIMYEWQSWSQCSCADGGCAQWRVRNIAHHAACGGAECGRTKEGKSCVTVASTLKETLIWVFIVICLLAVIALVIYLLVRLYKKKRAERLVFEKTNAKKRKAESKKAEKKKEEKKEKQGEKLDDVIEETQQPPQAEFHEFDESILTAREVDVNESTPKESTPKMEKKKKKKKQASKKAKKEENVLDDSGIADESMKADPTAEDLDKMFGMTAAPASKQPLPVIDGGRVELPALRGEPTLQGAKWGDEFGDLLDESKA